MYIILLKFSENKSSAKELMQAHNDWIAKGFSDGVFLLVGSIEPGAGGSILAHNESLDDLKQRVSCDPFVAEKVVTAEVLEISPKKTDSRLDFLIG